MPSLYDLLSSESQEIFRPKCLEHKVYRVPDIKLKFATEGSSSHYVLVLYHKGDVVKYMYGTSIKSGSQLFQVANTTGRLVVLAEELRQQSRLSKKDGAFRIQRSVPFQLQELEYHEELDDFSTAEYTDTILSRVKKLRKNIKLEIEPL